MINPSDVLVVTTEYIPGFRIVAMLGEVSGGTSRSNHGSVAAFGSSLKPVQQGELIHFTKTVDEAKDEAMMRMKEAAAAKGANAILSMRLAIDSISELSTTALAYGTAVVLTKE
ncbi:MAG TPA: hypothetical protein DEB24_04780 [Coriobacteriia bacterium]|nr:hypothetical protein [Coriobacteriia bacterium]